MEDSALAPLLHFILDLHCIEWGHNYLCQSIEVTLAWVPYFHPACGKVGSRTDPIVGHVRACYADTPRNNNARRLLYRHDSYGQNTQVRATFINDFRLCSLPWLLSLRPICRLGLRWALLKSCSLQQLHRLLVSVYLCTDDMCQWVSFHLDQSEKQSTGPEDKQFRNCATQALHHPVLLRAFILTPLHLGHFEARVHPRSTHLRLSSRPRHCTMGRRTQLPCFTHPTQKLFLELL